MNNYQYYEIPAILQLFIVTIVLNARANKTKVQNVTSQIKQKQYWFKDYVKKYSPKIVWEKIDKKRKGGENITIEEEVETMLDSIDPSDDLLSLKVTNGNPRIILNNDGRRWEPPGKLMFFDTYNKWSIRQRIFELMKQSIFQARNRMVIMQTLRDKYRNQSLYKMGFLISKTDTACKTFSRFAYKAFRACSNVRQEVFFRHSLQDIFHTEERLLSLWFDVELLVDLIKKNDRNLQEMLDKVFIYRKEAWKFED